VANRLRIAAGFLAAIAVVTTWASVDAALAGGLVSWWVVAVYTALFSTLLVVAIALPAFLLLRWQAWLHVGWAAGLGAALPIPLVLALDARAPFEALLRLAAVGAVAGITGWLVAYGPRASPRA
jgi:hypothetical protein